jgi:hypothetical protein
MVRGTESRPFRDTLDIHSTVVEQVASERNAHALHIVEWRTACMLCEQTT